MCRIVLQIGVCKLRCVACSIDDAVYQKLVAGCALYCFPCQGVAGRGLSGLIVCQVCRCCQIRVQFICTQIAIVLEAFQNQGLLIFLRIGVGDFTYSFGVDF